MSCSFFWCPRAFQFSIVFGFCWPDDLFGNNIHALCSQEDQITQRQLDSCRADTLLAFSNDLPSFSSVFGGFVQCHVKSQKEQTTDATGKTPPLSRAGT